MAHGPVFAAGPETTLTAVWARRREAAEELAAAHGAEAVDRVEDLYVRCDAVAFCVPPAVQAELAIGAAQAGMALILEKPIAADVAGAQRLADAVAAAGVPSLVALTWRYSGVVREFLANAVGFEAYGGRGTFVSGGLAAGPFRTPWRLEMGALLDLGPHVLDLLDAALGPIVSVRAAGNSLRWVSLQLEHESGSVSEAALCAGAPLEPHRAGAELYGPTGVLEVDCATGVGGSAFRTLRAEAAEMTRGRVPHSLDVRRGLYLQRIIEEARSQL